MTTYASIKTLGLFYFKTIGLFPNNSVLGNFIVNSKDISL